MGNVPHYPWYMDDYLSSQWVMTCTLKQEGIYRRLLDYQWKHEGCQLPDDIKYLRSLCKRQASEDQIRSVLEANFTLITLNFDTKVWRNERLYVEFCNVLKKSELARNAVKCRKTRPIKQSSDSLKIEHHHHRSVQSEVNHSYPEPYPKPEPEIKALESKDTPPALPASGPSGKKSKKDYVFEGVPSWISEPEWNAYVEMRKKIRAPLTDWAMHLTVLDLETLMKVGHEPNKVLNQSTQKSWRGVFAITDDGQKQKGGKSFADQKRDKHDVAKREAAKILGIRPSCSGETRANDSAGNNGSRDPCRLDIKVIEGVAVEDTEVK